MAKKEMKPFPAYVAIPMLLAFLVAMAMFVVYVVNPIGTGENSHVDSLGEQSFQEDSSIEPPPPTVDEVKEYMSDAHVGDVVTYGKYEQNGNNDDGKENIEWVVLDKNDDYLLLISRYCLDCKPFNETRESVSWNDSDLRNWLNDDFYNNAFSSKEKEGIVEYDEVFQVDGTSESYTITISDKVTILSTFDAERYYEYDSWRVCAPTEYAEYMGARVENDFTWWWLRGLDKTSDKSFYVYFNGTVHSGFSVDYDAVAVRPVIRVRANVEKE